MRQGPGLGHSIDPNREFWSLIRPQLSAERSAGWERSAEGSGRGKRNNTHTTGTGTGSTTATTGNNNKGGVVTSSYTLHSTSGDSIGTGSMDRDSGMVSQVDRGYYYYCYYYLGVFISLLYLFHYCVYFMITTMYTHICMYVCMYLSVLLLITSASCEVLDHIILILLLPCISI